MSYLIIGLLVLSMVHMLPFAVSARTKIVNTLGKPFYFFMFSLLSLAGVILIVLGKTRAPLQVLWTTPAWGRNIALGVMLVAFIVLVAAYLPSNIKRFTRHPMGWAIILWAVAHLLNRGDIASIILFTTIGLLSGLMMVLANRRGAQKSTLNVSMTGEAKVILVGLSAYIVVLFLHPYFIGVAIL